MPDTTEIYLCKIGQALKEGRIEYSEYITTKLAAETDAIARCRKDNTLAKVAYYAVGDDGKFRVIYTHKNPSAIGLDKSALSKGVQVKYKKRKQQAKPTLWQRLTGKVGR